MEVVIELFCLNNIFSGNLHRSIQTCKWNAMIQKQICDLYESVSRSEVQSVNTCTCTCIHTHGD